MLHQSLLTSARIWIEVEASKDTRKNTHHTFRTIVRRVNKVSKVGTFGTIVPEVMTKYLSRIIPISIYLPPRQTFA